MKLSWFILLVACGPRTTPAGVIIATEDEALVAKVLQAEQLIIASFEAHPLLGDVRTKVKGKRLVFGETRTSTCPDMVASQWVVSSDMAMIYALWTRDCEDTDGWGIDPDTYRITPGTIFDVVYTLKTGHTWPQER